MYVGRNTFVLCTKKHVCMYRYERTSCTYLREKNCRYIGSQIIARLMSQQCTHLIHNFYSTTQPHFDFSLESWNSVYFYLFILRRK